MSKRMMHLVGHLTTGPVLHHAGAWRHPESDVTEILSPERYERLAKIYERGLFDGVLLVDYLYLPGMMPDGNSVHIKHGSQMALLDPMIVLAQMARVTEYLGLAATMSTLMTNPYSIARQFATLDHFSKGRAGWNIVTATTPLAVQNYGLAELPRPDERYDHADEVMKACLALWSTWDHDALEVNRETGRFADPSKVHYVGYEGKRVQLHGALTTPQSPQGHPVFLQAGASDRGRQFASRWAEAIFTHQFDAAGARAFYSDIKGRLVSYGRAEDSCAVLPAVEVFVDTTEGQAQEQAAYLDSLVDREVGLAILSNTFGRDLLHDPLDAPISQVKPGPNAVGGIYQNAVGVQVDGREATLGEVAHLQATTWLSPRLVGTPDQVADELQDRFESGCCDGFVVTHALSPGSLNRFVDLVVPELQKRGIYRERYVGSTFRENLQDSGEKN